MKKLKLDLDALVVESFAVQETPRWTGTVQGNIEQEGEVRRRPGFFSRWFSCPSACGKTCLDTCWETCQNTCLETCQDTCVETCRGATCFDSCNTRCDTAAVSGDSGCDHVSFCHDYPGTVSYAERC